MRICYFGGTFDPPHRAHLHVARAAVAAFHLDRVLLAPAGVQPLKADPPKAGYEDRLAMTRLLCAGDERLEASDLDGPRGDNAPNYTIDALERLRTQYPDADLFVLAGIDSFLTLPHWRDPQRLLAAADWIVVSRPGISADQIALLGLAAEQMARVHLLNGVEEEVSATGIRERLRFGVSCGDMLTPTVSLYIARMHLYHAR